MGRMSVCMQFTGDILCQMPQTEACRVAEGYDYSPVLAGIRDRLSACDYLVGNLETPVAGEALGYSDRLYQFNTPDGFLDMLGDAGFHLMSTANNHCMDRNTEGLFATLDALDRRKIAHVGTYRSEEERNAPFVVPLGGIRFGFMAYTYGTNAFFHHMYLRQPWAVNLLQPEEERPGAIDLLDAPSVPGKVAEMYRSADPFQNELISPMLEKLATDVKALRAARADYIIMLLHCGGQHQLAPDAYTCWIAEYLSRLGVDLIVGNHQHILHPCARLGKTRIAYCLGNLTDTPNHNPNGQGIGEEYSILLRLFFAKGPNGVAVDKADFVPVKSVLDAGGRSVVRRVAELIAQAKNENERDRLRADLEHFVNLVRGTPQGTPVQVAQAYSLGCFEGA